MNPMKRCYQCKKRKSCCLFTPSQIKLDWGICRQCTEPTGSYGKKAPVRYEVVSGIWPDRQGLHGQQRTSE